MSRVLRRSVAVGGKVYRPGEAPPPEVAARITNAAAWAPGESAEAPSEKPDGIPPKGGAGSSTEAWAAYAAGKVEVGPDATRDDIIAALEAAGVPTE